MRPVDTESELCVGLRRLPRAHNFSEELGEGLADDVRVGAGRAVVV
jgi:hypothetical protein